MRSEHIPSTALEILGPPEQEGLQGVVAKQMQQASLSPWEQFKVSFEVKRRQADVVRKLIALEADAVVAEAVIATEARLDEEVTKAAVAQLPVKFECLMTAGKLREDAIAEAFRLSEGSREVVQEAMERVFAATVAKVEDRGRRR